MEWTSIVLACQHPYLLLIKRTMIFSFKDPSLLGSDQ